MSFQPSTLSPQPSVHLHIERLVLDGLPLEHGEGPLLLAAVEAELTCLLAGPGWPALAGGAWASAAAKPISLSGPGSPARTATRLAQAVYHAVTETCSLPSDRFSVGGDGRETPTGNQPQSGIKL
jgi:hypothetical protein